jgi:hypothetical protein
MELLEGLDMLDRLDKPDKPDKLDKLDGYYFSAMSPERDVAFFRRNKNYSISNQLIMFHRNMSSLERMVIFIQWLQFRF